MNKQRKDVLNILYRHSVTNQREISELSGHSLGVVNKSIKELMNQGYINEKCSVTTKALKEFKEKAPDRKSTRLNSSHTQKSRMPSSA